MGNKVNNHIHPSFRITPKQQYCPKCVKRQGFTLAEEKDPVKRLRNLEKKQVNISKEIIKLLDSGQIISDEIKELKKEMKK